VVSIFLLVVDEDHLAFALTEVVSNRYLMDFLAKGDTFLFYRSGLSRYLATLNGR
jgi:hypothetical protein